MYSFAFLLMGVMLMKLPVSDDVAVLLLLRVLKSAAEAS
jgi:hypothetical protein